MKSFKKLILFCVVFLLSGCVKETQTYKYEETPEVELEHEYSEVSDYELLWETMFDVDSDNYYVYIYSTTCNHCVELKNYIILKALEQRNIYFVKGSSKDQLGNDINLSKNAENPRDIWILGYPSLIQIKAHKCVKNLAGINQIKGELK